MGTCLSAYCHRDRSCHRQTSLGVWFRASVNVQSRKSEQAPLAWESPTAFGTALLRRNIARMRGPLSERVRPPTFGALRIGVGTSRLTGQPPHQSVEDTRCGARMPGEGHPASKWCRRLSTRVHPEHIRSGPTPRGPRYGHNDALYFGTPTTSALGHHLDGWCNAARRRGEISRLAAVRTRPRRRRAS